MEAIREYLNNLFMNLPETPTVLRAKAELMEMMEDKFEELIHEGKSEKEAVGIVISEFGNFEEIATELGINEYLHEKGEEAKEEEGKASEPKVEGYSWNLNNVKNYMDYAWKHAWFIAIGVLLCITAPYASDVLGAIGDANGIAAILFFGEAVLFLMVGIAVALFCTASAMSKKVGKVNKMIIMLDDDAQSYMKNENEKDERKCLTMRIVGIFLCIVSVVPSCIQVENVIAEAILGDSVLPIVGAGVLLLVLSCSVRNRYEELEKAMKKASKAGVWKPGQDMDSIIVKQKMPVAVIILLVISGILIAIGCLVLGVTSLFSAYRNTTSVEHGKNVGSIEDVQEFAPGNITNVIVDADFSNVQIEMADVPKIQVRYEGNKKYAVTANESNGSLHIEENYTGGFSFFNLGNYSCKTTILVPKEKQDLYFDIVTDAGNVIMNDVVGTKLHMEVDAGNIEGTNCKFTDGEIDADAGNVEFSNTLIDHLAVVLDAGNIEYSSARPLEQYDMNLTVDLGSIHVNDVKQSGGYQVTKGNNAKITIEADMGNIELNDAANDA